MLLWWWWGMSGPLDHLDYIPQIFIHSNQSRLFGRKLRQNVHKKGQHHKDLLVQYLRSDGEIWVQSQTYEPEQIFWGLPVLLWQETEGWIQEDCVRADVLGSLPTASQQAGYPPLEVSPSELMAVSCLAVAEVLRMERLGGLRIGTHSQSLLHAQRQRDCMWFLTTPRNYHTASDEILWGTKHL